MDRNMASLLLCLLLVVFPSWCVGDENQDITNSTWSFLVNDIVTGNQTVDDIVTGNHSSLAFQPVEISLPDGVFGGESLTFDRRGEGPYAGVSDGRVLKWDARAGVWTTFAYSANYMQLPLCHRAGAGGKNETVCGRPLGLQFHALTGDLYIADAYLGLMKVGPRGGVAKVLATKADDDGVPFTFVNGLDVDQATGDVYFTDSSRTYQRRDAVQIMYHRDATGRLLKYDARRRRVTVLRSGLPYPNGVAVSGDRAHVVVAHTWPSQVFRYRIGGDKAGRYELLADLPGYPDNLRRDGTAGGYWVALNQENMNFDATTGTVSPPPPGTPHLVGVRIDGRGAKTELLTAPKGVTLSDVAVKDAKQMWLGSVELGYVGLVDYTMLR
jgi:sugar lactone lactonase YvrE